MWRRAKILELTSQGHTQRDIADMLHVDESLISKDLVCIRKEAQESLKTHIQEKLPAEYQKAMAGLNQVLKTCWNIVKKDTTDDNTKLLATAVINDSYKFLIDLTTNGVVITDAIKYVQGQMDHLNKTEIIAKATIHEYARWCMKHMTDYNAVNMFQWKLIRGVQMQDQENQFNGLQTTSTSQSMT